MPPRISGALNNCSLMCALPTILEQIDRYSNQEPNINDPIVKQYETLKTLFAQYYLLEHPETLTWKMLSIFLAKYSFYAKQLMFGPVFRQFIALHGPNHGYQQHDLWLLKDIQFDGRYNYLDAANEAQKLFYTPLGIKATIYECPNVCEIVKSELGPAEYLNTHQAPDQALYCILKHADNIYLIDRKNRTTIELEPSNNPETYTKLSKSMDLLVLNQTTIADNNKMSWIENVTGLKNFYFDGVYHVSEATEQQALHAQNTVADISIYFKENHYELQAHEDREQANAEFNEQIENLDEDFMSLHEKISSGDSDHDTNEALGCLIQTVNQRFETYLHRLQTSSDQPPNTASWQYEPISPLDYLEKGRAFHNDTASGNCTFAMIILMLMPPKQYPKAEELLRLMQNITDQDLANQLAKSIIGSESLNLSTLEVCIARSEATEHVNSKNISPAQNTNQQIRHFTIEDDDSQLLAADHNPSFQLNCLSKILAACSLLALLAAAISCPMAVLGIGGIKMAVPIGCGLASMVGYGVLFSASRCSSVMKASDYQEVDDYDRDNSVHGF